MKTTCLHPTRSKCLRAAGSLGLALGLSAASASAATNFVYDLSVTPDTLPPNPPWTRLGAGTETASGRLLTIQDTATNNDGPYYQRSLTLSDISSTSEWEARARVRVTSYDNSADPLSRELPAFRLQIHDGSRFITAGMTLVGGNTHVFLMDPSGSSGFGVFSAAAPTGDDFFHIRLRKVGTTGTSADLIQLYVDNVLVDTENYGNMGAISDRLLFFGAPGSFPLSTVELTGASFGIGETAPLLLPEPSAAALCLLGILIGWRQIRRRN